MREEEVENANIEIVHKQATSFTADWLTIRVTDDRYTVETQDPAKSFELRDLVHGTFSVLEHTPIRAFGLNTVQHFQIASEAEWHAIGDFYAPKDPWRDLFDPQTRIGMRALSIMGDRIDTKAKRVEIRIEPSLDALPYGLFVNVNLHYRVAGETEAPGNVEPLLEALSNQWEGLFIYREKVAKHLFSQVPSLK